MILYFSFNTRFNYFILDMGAIISYDESNFLEEATNTQLHILS